VAVEKEAIKLSGLEELKQLEKKKKISFSVFLRLLFYC